MKNRKFRPLKSIDHEMVQKAIDIINDIMYLNSQIEKTLWASTLFFCLVNGYKNYGFSYKEFREEADDAFSHYKIIFDE